VRTNTVAVAQVASFEDEGLARPFDPLPLHHSFPVRSDYFRPVARRFGRISSAYIAGS
jgi:hypothetical protein